MVLAAGKYLISEEIPNKNFEIVKMILESISCAIKAPVSGSVDTKRLALVVVRTISRMHFEVSLSELFISIGNPIAFFPMAVRHCTSSLFDVYAMWVI